MCDPKYEDLGLGAIVVLTFSDLLILRGFVLLYHIDFDNFFTGTLLLKALTKNRASSCLLISSKTCKRKELGAYYRTTHDDKFIIDNWHDNIFSILANAVGIYPMQSSRRFS